MVEFKLRDYQQDAWDFAWERLVTQKQAGCGLFLDPGLGKTLISLSLFAMMKILGLADTALITCPIRPMYSVWPYEIEKWGFPFTHKIIHGTINKRVKALRQHADIHLINPEGVAWLVNQDKEIQDKWDIAFIDESSMFRNWTAKRTKALKKLRNTIEKFVLLTGTPSPNHLGDLFSQVYMIDKGETLGKTVTYFRSQYMVPAGFQNKQWAVRSKFKQEIRDKIGPLVFHASAADHLNLPPVITNRVIVELPPDMKRQYDNMEKQLFLELEQEEKQGRRTLLANGAGGKYHMCRGIANGGVYETDEMTEERSTHQLHRIKVEACEEIVEELAGKPVMIAYPYDHDLERLLEAFPDAPVIKGKGKKKYENQVTNMTKFLDEWAEGKHPVLLVQPAAMSHGVDRLQHGSRHVIWFALTDQPEIHTQFNGRLIRQGQTGSVVIHYILAKGTVDEMVIKRIVDKDAEQKTLLQSLKEYRDAKWKASISGTGDTRRARSSSAGSHRRNQSVGAA